MTATKEISHSAWDKFCELLNEAHHLGMIDIQTIQRDGTSRCIVNDTPLQRIWFDHSGACNDKLVFEFGQSGENGQQHEIIEPIHVRVKPGDGGRYKSLEITAENGTTVVTFYPGLSPAILEGFEGRS